MRGVWRWLADWRTGVAVAATGLVVLLGFVVVDSSLARREAFESLQTSREIVTRRIDLLTATIDEQAGTIAAAEAAVAGLRQDVAALQAQLRALGVDPVVAAVTTPESPSAAPAPAAQPPPAPPAQPASGPDPPAPQPSPARNPPPSPEPEPQPTGLLDPITDLTCTLGLLC